MLEYARSDTIHLISIYCHILDELSLKQYQELLKQTNSDLKIKLYEQPTVNINFYQEACHLALSNQTDYLFKENLLHELV